MDKCIKRKTSNEKYLFIYDGVKFHQYCDFILKYYPHAKDKIITYVNSVLYMLKMIEKIILQKRCKNCRINYSSVINGSIVILILSPSTYE